MKNKAPLTSHLIYYFLGGTRKERPTLNTLIKLPLKFHLSKDYNNNNAYHSLGAIGKMCWDSRKGRINLG